MYTPKEIQEMVAMLSKELREGHCSEAHFRMSMAKFNYNIAETDRLIEEAMKLT